MNLIDKQIEVFKHYGPWDGGGGSMANSKIEWTDKTWNPVTGCTKISEGCQHCYADRMSKRLAGRCGYDADKPFGVTLHPDKLTEPMHWKKPSKIFVCSMGDLFHDDVPFGFLDDVFSIMVEAKKHTFIVLTKRPQRMFDYMMSCQRGANDIGGKFPWDNVWLGVTAENQKRADERLPILRQIPAAKKLVSVEPMLGSIDMSSYLGDLYYCEKHGRLCSEGVTYADDYETVLCKYCRQPVNITTPLNWVICGGETGPGARPMHPDWVRSLKDQCQCAGTPFFFKSWGDWLPAHVLEPHTAIKFDGKIGRYAMKKVGKKHSGRLLDGVEWNEYPEAHA